MRVQRLILQRVFLAFAVAVITFLFSISSSSTATESLSPLQLSDNPVSIHSGLLGETEVLLTFRSSLSVSSQQNIELLHNTHLRHIGGLSYVASFQAPIDALSVARFKAIDNLESAELNSKILLADLPNDPYIQDGTQWAVLSEAAGIGADESWAEGYSGTAEVVVAVIDTGVQITHPDLAENIWVNQDEANGVSGIDDDNNGFIDDINGWDFVFENASLFDTNESAHGSHVSGIIAARANNASGVAGVAYQTKVLPIKALTGDGGRTADVIEAIDYVTMLRTKKNVNIVAINASWGSSMSSRALLAAIKRAGDAGIVFVSAAGNQTRDINMRRYFPASYDCSSSIRNWDCNITVGSFGSTGEVSWFSNYGVGSVEIAAPGSAIISTVPEDTYGFMSGTSMAAPHVSAAIAVCASAYQGTNVPLRSQLLFDQSVQNTQISEYFTYGRLQISNLGSACNDETTSFGGQFSDVIAEAIYTDVVNLRWSDTATGEYGTEIQIAEGGCQSEFVHLAYIGPGLTSYRVSGLEEATFYCFRIRAYKNELRSTWAQSNLTVTWTTNLPFVYGYVTTEDGSPVADAQVNWTQDVASGSHSLSTFSDPDGFYAIQVSPGSGKLWVSSLPHHSSVGVRGQTFASPVIPMGLKAGGKLSLENDTNIDITLPPLVDVTFRVTDELTGEPVAGARLYGTFYSALCNGSKDVFKDEVPKAYKPWPDAIDGAVTAYCEFSPLGTAKTDSNGNLTIAVVHNDLYLKKYKGAFVFPNDKTRLIHFEFTADENKVVDLAIPVAEDLSGQVLTADGVPAGRVRIEWTPALNNRDTLRQWMYTDEQGNYSFSATPGTGYLTVTTPPVHKTAEAAGYYIYPLVDLPVNLRASGSFDFDGTNSPDFILPPTYSTTFNVLDSLTDEPIANARVTSVRSSEMCNNRSDVWNDAITRAYLPFAGAGEGDTVNANCEFSPFAGARTNGEGSVTFTLIRDALYSRDYKGSVIVNGQLARAETFAFRATENATVDVQIDAPHLLTGSVVSAGGEPVGSIRVNWKPTAGTSADITRVYTDSEGKYSLEVSAGEGSLWVSTPGAHVSMADRAVIFPSIHLPTGLRAGGAITITGDTAITLTLPPVVTKTFTVVDAYSNDPVPHAEIVSPGSGYTCNGDPERFKDEKPRIYLPFPGARDGYMMTANCDFSPFQLAETNSAGEITLTFIADSLYMAQYQFGVVHPMQAARIGKKEFRATTSATDTIVIPGTPSQPKWSSTLVSTESVTLTWDEPWDGSSYIDYYNVHIATDLNGPYTLVSQGSCAGNINPTLRTCIVEGLTTGVRYFFIVVAHNEVGYSEPSTATSALPLHPAYVPILGEVTQNPFGFTVQITNFLQSYNWSVSASRGTATISLSGLVQVSGLNPGESSEITITAEKADSHSGSLSQTFSSLNGKKIKELDTGLSHTCAITNMGELWCWGSNRNGQLGNGTTVSSSVPQRVVIDKSFTDISVGDNFTCGVADAKVWCWGSNTNGQLGDGTTKQKLSPVLVNLNAAALNVSLGRAHSCVLTMTQSVWCWGSNTNGQLGDGTTKQKTTPTPIKNLSTLNSITTGANHTCATIGEAATLWCWGSNTRGQLGDGTFLPKFTPTHTLYIGTPDLVRAGGDQTFVFSKNYELSAWGQNSSNQLGDSTTISRNLPLILPSFWNN